MASLVVTMGPALIVVSVLVVGAALVSLVAVARRLRSLRASQARLRAHAADVESRLEQRTAELRAKSEEMDRLLHALGHDLRTPLISIEGYARSLEEDHGGVLQGEGALFLERIGKNATHMASLLDAILEIPRIGGHRGPVEDIDLNRLLDEVGGRLGDAFRQAGGRLEVQPALPSVRGERSRLDQLFAGLVENALKHRHPQRAPLVRVDGETTAEGAVVRVTDNGVGVPPGIEDELFLATVKRIVETHGGRMWMRSAEGEGSVVHVLLPVERDAPTVRARDEPAA